MSLHSSKLILGSIPRHSISKQWLSHKQSILVQSLSARNTSQNSIPEKLYSTTSRATSHLQQNSTTHSEKTTRTNDRNGRNRRGRMQSQLLQIQQVPWYDTPGVLGKIGERARLSTLASSDVLPGEGGRPSDLLIDALPHDEPSSATLPESQDPTNTVNARMLMLKRAQDLEAVLAEFHAMEGKGITRNLHTFNIVLDAMASLRREDSVITPLLQVYNEMLTQGISPSTFAYATIIKSLCRRDSEIRSRIEHVNNRKQHDPSWGMSPDVWNQMIERMIAEKPLPHALTIFDAAVQTRRVQDFTVEVFNLLLKALANQPHKSTADALYVFEQLEKSTCQPDSVTFLHLMEVYGRAGDLLGAQEVFKEYLATIATKQVLTSYGRNEQYSIYRAMTEAHLISGDVEGAMKILLDVVPKHIGRNSSGFMMVIDHHIQRNETDKAYAILLKMVEATDQNSEAYKEGYARVSAAAIQPLLLRFAETKDFDKAKICYKSMVGLNSTAEVSMLPTIVYMRALLKAQRWEDVVWAARDLRSRGMIIDPQFVTEAMQSMLVVRGAGETTALRQAMEFMCELAMSLQYRMESTPPAAREWGNEFVMRLLTGLETRVHGLKSSMEMSRILLNLKVFSPETADLLIGAYNSIRGDSEQWNALKTLLSQEDFQFLYELLFMRKGPFSDFQKTVFDLLHDIQEVQLSPPLSTYTRVLLKLRKHSQVQAAEQWERAFGSVVISGEAMKSEVIQKAKDANDERLARRWGGTAGGDSAAITHQSDVKSTEILAAALSGDYEKSARLTKELVDNGLTPSPEVMRDAINNAGKNQRLDLAEQMWQLADHSFARMPPYRASRARHMCLSSLMAGYAINKDIPKAKEIHEKIKALGFLPDSNAYASLLLGMSEESHDEAEDAARILTELRKHNIKRNNFFYNVIISKFGKGRRADDALAVFEELKAEKLGNTVTYGAIVSACLRGGAETTAEKLFEEMQQQPTYQPRVGVFHSMMAHYTREQPNRAKALHYFDLLKRSPKLTPNSHSYKLLMEVHAIVEPYDITAAENVLAEMQEQRIAPEPTHFATLIYAKGVLVKDLEGAKQVYDEIVTRGLVPDDTVYQAVLDAYISNGDIISAERIRTDFLTRHKSTPYIENLFIRGYADAGSLAKAVAVFEAMVDSGDPERPPDLTRVVLREPSTYETMVRAYVAAGELDKAQEVVGVMELRDWPDKVIKVVRDLVPAAEGGL